MNDTGKAFLNPNYVDDYCLNKFQPCLTAVKYLLHFGHITIAVANICQVHFTSYLLLDAVAHIFFP